MFTIVLFCFSGTFAALSSIILFCSHNSRRHRQTSLASALIHNAKLITRLACAAGAILVPVCIWRFQPTSSLYQMEKFSALVELRLLLIALSILGGILSSTLVLETIASKFEKRGAATAPDSKAGAPRHRFPEKSNSSSGRWPTLKPIGRMK